METGKIKYLYLVLRNMGVKYVLFRIWYLIKTKIGLMKILFPSENDNKFNFTSKEEFITTIIQPKLKKFQNISCDNGFSNYVEKTISGEVCFFSGQWIPLGKQYDWISNPLTSYTYDISKHWSEVRDFANNHGDIKYVWEKSRFSYLLPIMCYDFQSNENHAEFVFYEIEDWIDCNPINQGPNWRCSQEISIRMLNWYFLLSYYKDSPHFTDSLWHKMQNVIYWSLHHVYNNINFSRIAVRNNHAITETLLLALSEILFPFIPETTKWAMKGRKWFEKEIEFQIASDGTYLQHSMNYHRVVIQLLSVGIAITESSNKPFSKIVYDRAYSSLYFLYQCIDDETGRLPNYGPNDGALFFPLSHTDYLDYRSQLNTLHKLLTNEFIYECSRFKEEFNWLKFNSCVKNKYPKIQKKVGLMSFNDGGYYLIRDLTSLTFVRCADNIKKRPTHADNLHIDLWVDSENIIRDGGSYKYNTTPSLSKYFGGTESHNTVMLSNFDQMLKGTRFTWLYWSTKKYSLVYETPEFYVFEGEINAFKYLGKNIRHNRIIKKKKNCNEWIIKDTIYNKPSDLTMNQLWHTKSERVELNSNNSEESISDSYESLYYGIKSHIKQIKFTTLSSSIITKITYS